MPDLATASILDGLYTVQDLARICQTKGTEWIEEGCRKRNFAFTMVARCYRFTPEQAIAIIKSLAVEPKRVPTRDEVGARRQTRRAA